jgi:hypothetical protein
MRILAIAFAVLVAQVRIAVVSAQSQSVDQQINVNWLYGSYVPRDVPLQPLDSHARFKLYVRQTYTTPGHLH